MPDSLDDLGASFRRHLLADGKAADTVKLYGQAVRFYARWLTDNDHTATLDQLNRENLSGWFAALHSRHEDSTVLMRWQGMNRFCKWLIDEGELDSNPMRAIQRPQPKSKPVPIIDDADLTKLLNTCKGKDFDSRRDEVIIRLLLDAGVRVAELCSFTVLTQTELDAGAKLITGKGGKQRMVYFGVRTARAIDRYLRVRARHRWAHVDALLIGQRGALTPDGVRTRMEVRAEEAGLSDPSNPHRFRHTWAHDFLLHDGGERNLKRLAGWSSDAMLSVYGQAAADTRAAAAAKKLRRGDRV